MRRGKSCSVLFITQVEKTESVTEREGPKCPVRGALVQDGSRGDGWCVYSTVPKIQEVKEREKMLQFVNHTWWWGCLPFLLLMTTMPMTMAAIMATPANARVM